MSKELDKRAWDGVLEDVKTTVSDGTVDMVETWMKCPKCDYPMMFAGVSQGEWRKLNALLKEKEKEIEREQKANKTLCLGMDYSQLEIEKYKKVVEAAKESLAYGDAIQTLGTMPIPYPLYSDWIKSKKAVGEALKELEE